MNRFVIIMAALLLAIACNTNKSGDNTNEETRKKAADLQKQYDERKGVGKFTQVDINPSIDITMVTAGNKIYDVKCASCHKLSSEKLVGPGWKGVTERREPVWVMNFITNTEEMLTKDPALQSQLEICMVKMPNQNLTDTDARNVYEFMRKNDTNK
ncbi:MAG TPA: cytochrome c [Chitinophagaceae bacterium]|nr:cytochrome c [Chitinophagaceae bacterium]